MNDVFLSQSLLSRNLFALCLDRTWTPKRDDSGLQIGRLVLLYILTPH